MQLYNLIIMWYTKNLIKTAQLTIIPVPADDAKNGKKIERYNYYVNAINKNIKNKQYLNDLYNNINSEPNDRFDQTNGKTKLQETIWNLLNITKSKAGQTEAQGTTNTFTPESMKVKINEAIKPYGVSEIQITYDQNNYFASVKTTIKGYIYPYLFNFKNEDELNRGIVNLVDRLKSLQNDTSRAQNDTGALKQDSTSTNNTETSDLEMQIKGSGNSAQPLELISPKTSGGKFQFYVKDLNGYNELVNNLILTITVTPNDQEKYFRSIAVTPQLNNPNISNAAKNTIAEMINQIKNEAIYKLAKDNSGKLIPSVNTQSDFEPVQATNYQNVAFPIEVPAARDGAVDIFIDGQKIASIKNNSQFILNPQKYPLFAGSHTLEAKVAGMMNTPERPVSDRFLKVLSKVRKYDFQVMSDGSIKFQNSSNDIDSFKPAENYAGSGLASKVPTNTMNLLADQIEVQNEEAIEVFLKDQDRNIPTIINNWKNKLRTLPMEEYTNKDKRKELLRNEITLFFQNEAKTRVSPGNNTLAPLAPDDTP